MKSILAKVAIAVCALAGMARGLSAQQVSQGNLLGPPLHVQLVDAYTGTPIVGAPVQMLGVPQLKTTDSAGWVMFRKQGGKRGDLAKLWTTPTGYAPASRQTVLASSVNFLTLYIPPLNTFTTGLIDPQTGGSFVFNSTLPSVPPLPFYMEVHVPPGALPEALSINITPYPRLALWHHGLPAQAIQFGAVHVNVTDSAGQTATESLALPVTFRVRGYSAGADLSGYDTDTLSLYRYNYDTHEWSYDSAPTSIDLATNTFTVQTDHFSILSGCSQPLPTVTTPLPVVDVVDAGHECQEICQAGVICGQANGDCSVTQSQGSTVSISGTIASSLNAQFGEKVGNDVVGSISSKVGINISGSVTGGLTGSTGKTVTGGVNQGGSVGGACFSGSVSVWLVAKKKKIMVGGSEIGTISVPEKVVIVTQLQGDPSCCEEIPPPTPGLPQKPDDCQ